MMRRMDVYEATEKRLKIILIISITYTSLFPAERIVVYC